MKRWLIHLTIFSYLSCLAWGIFSHATFTKTNSSPAMYYIVWDMFCGWNAYSTRNHVIAQGESGKYYRLTPGPWREYQPYGYQERTHYDPVGIYTRKMALNTLKHTQHEPITRIFLIEESWAKKYNMPEKYWAAKYDEPKDEHRYCHAWQILDGDGTILQQSGKWISQQTQLSILSNPQLRMDSIRNRPFIAVKSQSNAGYTSTGSPLFPIQSPTRQSTVNGN